jgi:hypothetical protein
MIEERGIKMIKFEIPKNIREFNLSEQTNFLYCPKCREVHPANYWRDTTVYCLECDEAHNGLLCPHGHEFNCMEDELKGGYNPTLQLHIMSVKYAMDNMNRFLNENTLIKDDK